MDPTTSLIQLINALNYANTPPSINANLTNYLNLATQQPQLQYTLPQPVNATVVPATGGHTVFQQLQGAAQKQSPPSYANTTGPPKARFNYGTCRTNGVVAVIGVRRSFGQYFYYEYNCVKNTFSIHQCAQCQVPVRECHLSPLYAEYDRELRKKVLFVRNGLTARVEQFVYAFPTGTLHQVARPKLAYDHHKVVLRSNLIAFFKSDDGRETVVFERTVHSGLRKMRAKGDGFEELPEANLTMLPDVKKEEDPNPDTSTDHLSDYEPTAMEQAYYTHLSQSNPLSLINCVHIGHECLIMFNTTQLRYLTFFYHDQVGAFVEHQCAFCIKDVVEGLMFPKYAQEHQGQHVIHVHNAGFGVMEQYVYNGETQGFEQVFYPELKYDASRDTEGWIVHSGEYLGVPTVIMKDGQQRIRKEHYSVLRKKYVAIPAMPVLTFSAQREAGQGSSVKELDEPDDENATTTPDIIDLGFKNPLADANGSIPVKPSSFPFARAFSNKQAEVLARLQELSMEKASTSGAVYGSQENPILVEDVVVGEEVEVEEEELMTKNQRKNRKKKEKRKLATTTAEQG